MIKSNDVLHLAAGDDGEFSLGVIETLDHENLISNRNLIGELRQGLHSTAQGRQLVCRGSVLRIDPLSKLL